MQKMMIPLRGKGEFFTSSIWQWCVAVVSSGMRVVDGWSTILRSEKFSLALWKQLFNVSCLNPSKSSRIWVSLVLAVYHENSCLRTTRVLICDFPILIVEKPAPLLSEAGTTLRFWWIPNERRTDSRNQSFMWWFHRFSFSIWFPN